MLFVQEIRLQANQILRLKGRSGFEGGLGVGTLTGMAGEAELHYLEG